MIVRSRIVHQLTVRNADPKAVEVVSKDAGKDAETGAKGGDPTEVPNMLKGRSADGLQWLWEGEVADQGDHNGSKYG